MTNICLTYTSNYHVEGSKETASASASCYDHSTYVVSMDIHIVYNYVFCVCYVY